MTASRPTSTHRWRARRRPGAFLLGAAASALLCGTFDGSVASAAAGADQAATRRRVETLASAQFDGRLTGTEGERLAAEYLAGELRRIGARPLPGAAGYRMPFEFTFGARDGGSELAAAAGSDRITATAAAGTMRALSFSETGQVEGPVVFAGYGIVVPESQGFAYDSFASLDVRDKIVVVLRYFPEDADPRAKAVLARYADLRYKAMAARQRGAKAMLVVTGPRSPNAGELVAMTFDTALSGSGLAAASIAGPVAERMLAAAGRRLEEVQRELDSGNPHVAGFELPNVTARVRTVVIRERRQGQNVLAWLPATRSVSDVEKPWVAVGAHYDHLGHGGNGSSLARQGEADLVHAGADDNASGTAAVLAAAEALSREPRRRHILLAFWSGEELGMLGSSAFAARPPVALDQILAYINFDMVGRMQDNRLSVQATGTSPAWARLIEQANIRAGFDLQVQPDPYQPTDVATFNQAGVPSLNLFTGTHADYHRPTDTADRIDYEDLDRVAAFAADIVRMLEEAPEPLPFTKVDQPAPGSLRAGVRVFTGTIPDYTSEAKGLLLGGVVGGGPAEQAGLQKGDVIVEIAGQSIANIYDYTYALELLKVGQPVTVVYLRNGRRLETQLTPAARK